MKTNQNNDFSTAFSCIFLSKGFMKKRVQKMFFFSLNAPGILAYVSIVMLDTKKKTGEV